MELLAIFGTRWGPLVPTATVARDVAASSGESESRSEGSGEKKSSVACSGTGIEDSISYRTTWATGTDTAPPQSPCSPVPPPGAERRASGASGFPPESASQLSVRVGELAPPATPERTTASKDWEGRGDRPMLRRISLRARRLKG